MTGIANRVVQIFRKRTSMRLTLIEWEAINAICQREHLPRKTLFELIDMNHDESMSLTASIRLFTIIYYKNLYTNASQRTDNQTFYNPVFEAIKGIV